MIKCDLQFEFKSDYIPCIYVYISITCLILDTLLNPYARCVPPLPYPLFAAQLNKKAPPFCFFFFWEMDKKCRKKSRFN